MGFDWEDDDAVVVAQHKKSSRPPGGARYERARARIRAFWDRLLGR